MEQRATTLTLDQAQPRAAERSAAAERANKAEIERRMQQASDAYTNSMFVATGLFFVGGGLLAGFGWWSPMVFALAITCVAGGIVLRHQAREKLRAALTERAVAEGAPAATAKAEAEAALRRTAG